MDPADGISIEDEKGVISETVEEGLVTDSKKEDNHIDNAENVPFVNGTVENLAKPDECISPTIGVNHSLADTVETITSNQPKVLKGGSQKDVNKTAKTKPTAKGGGPASLAPSAKSSLSHSLSFPAKKISVDASKKSVDGHPLRNDHSKTPKAVSDKAKTGWSQTKSVSSLSTLSTSNKRFPAGKNAEVGNSSASRRNTIATIPSTKKSLSVKPGPINKTVKAGPSGQTSINSDKDVKPITIEDEDARSTTSSNTTHGNRRNSTSGFSFRLEERAEKRKEFFTKLEEKIQAKEVEKIDMQAKSKETQKEEIKRLRKSLNFRAAPMPSFYKEPPQKVELKKIPITRPISPKLGRNKNTANNNGAIIEEEQEGKEENSATNSNKLTSGMKKLLVKAQSKLTRHNKAGSSSSSSATPKLGKKKSIGKPTEAKEKTEPATIEGGEEMKETDQNHSAIDDEIPNVSSADSHDLVQVAVEG